jgi:hypothetical protein
MARGPQRRGPRPLQDVTFTEKTGAPQSTAESDEGSLLCGPKTSSWPHFSLAVGV